MHPQGTFSKSPMGMVFEIPCDNSLFSLHFLHTGNVAVIGNGVRQGILEEGKFVHFSMFFEDVSKSKSTQFVKFSILECKFMPLKSKFNVDFSAYNENNS